MVFGLAVWLHSRQSFAVFFGNDVIRRDADHRVDDGHGGLMRFGWLPGYVNCLLPLSPSLFGFLVELSLFGAFRGLFGPSNGIGLLTCFECCAPKSFYFTGLLLFEKYFLNLFNG